MGPAATPFFTCRSAALLLIPALAVLALTAREARGDEPAGRFLRDRLVLHQELGAVLPFDLDGDGRDDLVVLEADRSRRDVVYTLRVLRQTAQGFAAEDAAAVQLPAHLSQVGMGAFQGGPGLAMLTPGQVTVWPWRKGRFVPEAGSRLAVQSLFPVPSDGLKPATDWIVDLNGDGVAELLVPRFDGLEVLEQAPDGGLRRRALLRVRADMEVLDWYRRSLIAYELPAVFVRQVDGRGWRDVVFFADGQLWVFALGEAPVGEAKKPVLYRDFQPPKPFDPSEPWDPPMRLVTCEDLNGDGHLDLVFTKNSASDSQFNTRTHVLIYYGRTGEGGTPLAFGAEPDQIYPSEGFSLPLLLDLNGDGYKDLVLVNVEIGFWNMIKALIQRSLNAQAAFYLMPADGRYPRDPQFLETYEVTFSLGHFAHRPVAVFGDLNGDGLPDLLLSVDKDTIGIHWGRHDGVWANEPDAELKDFIPIKDSRLRIGDLDGDGRDDLLFTYNRDDIRQMPDVNGTFTVLRSRYGKPRSTTPAATGSQAAAR